ncbi:hypothetical protein CCB80_02235 [Armatimonadetes bacterium Uphvl-Ar1]|nr:hypothetical protein CCB80_02235 [Armatimonadetes bacterium Uphvl-Ar1]
MMRSSDVPADVLQTYETFAMHAFCRPGFWILGLDAGPADLLGDLTGVRGRARACLRVHTLARVRKKLILGLQGLQVRFILGISRSAGSLQHRFNLGLQGGCRMVLDEVAL